ncbi:MAG: hypothetical protein MZW92_51920 [Comamonadaceae bacterium]|nr:hypothetical protein [Comamonadaceae bacterium]
MNGKTGDHHRHLPAAGRQRGRDRAGRCASACEELKAELPDRARLQDRRSTPASSR